MSVEYYPQVSNFIIGHRYNNIHNRCYNPNYHKGKNPYLSVCWMEDKWLGKEGRKNFKHWFKDGFYRIPGEQIDIDKDILIPGNKMYGSETCLFVPHTINVAVERIYREPVYMKGMDKWSISICRNGKNEPLGYFNTKEEAEQYYIEFKRAYYYGLIHTFKNKIPNHVYKAVIDFVCNDSNYHK